MPDPSDVAVVEDVWGPAFDDLAGEIPIRVVEEGWARPRELPDLLTGTNALVVRNRTPVDRALLAACPSLQVVARAGVGLDNIDVPAADDLGVVVVAPLGANAVSVAEHTLGLALAVARHTLPLDRGVRGGAWDRRRGRELANRTWGLLGFGATARATASLARGIGMRVVAYDPYVDAASTEGVTLHRSLGEVARQSDVLSVHLPATPETRHLVDADLLGQLPSDAILVSAGRGEVVDEDALADHLTDGRLHGAGLDVRAVEPPDAHRLHALDNVVLTPHVAGITEESQERIVRTIADDLRALLGGAGATHAVGAHRQLQDRR